MHVRCKLKKKGKGKAATLRARRFEGKEAANLRFADGVHRVDPGDWIIHDDEHDLDVVSAATFEKHYEITEEIPTLEAGR